MGVNGCQQASESSIAHARLLNQQVSRPAHHDPAEVVRWHGAIQAQDFAGGKWAVGLRLLDSAEAAVEDAFNQGRYLRTHVLRPTWHFVTPEDIRWMLELTAPRVNAAIGSYYRRAGLDDKIFRHSRNVLERELRDGGHSTRNDLVDALRRDGIRLDNVAYSHLLLRAELDGLICSGPRRGKQHTYMLLDHRVHAQQSIQHDEALAELTLRYFTSHGPATPKDFSWWSGLTIRDVRQGLELVAGRLDREVFGDAEFWFSPDQLQINSSSCSVYLLPNYDEYIVGYSDRSAYWHELHDERHFSRASPLSNNTVVVDGQIVGTWSRKMKASAVEVSVNLFAPLDVDARKAMKEAVDRYGRYLGLPAQLV